ncbi:LysR family transcriptional regulator [Asaia sp. VD9]|uniref:LysR family transcriptional regulator n=1 Tax=Asaia sp. VD9 TaxID=3081235 RepID=UPI0030181D5E
MSRSEYSVFVAVADSLNYTHAGKRLGIHASSVSRSLERLEDRLGVALIEPASEGLRLTEAGERLSHFLTPLLDTLEEGVRAICREEQNGGVLRVLAPPEILTGWVNPVIRAMLHETSGLKVSLEASVGLPDFRRAEADIFLSHRREEMQEGAYRIRRIGSYEVGLFAAPSLLERTGPLLSPDDLHGVPCLARPGETQWMLCPIGDDIAPTSFALEASVVATPAPVRLDFACAGSGVTAASLETCAPFLASGALERVLPGYRLPPGVIYAAQPERHQPRRVVAEFLSRLVERVRQNGAKQREISANPEDAAR